MLSAVLQSTLTVPLEVLERGYLPEMADRIAQFATEREKAEHEEGARDRDMSPIHQQHLINAIGERGASDHWERRIFAARRSTGRLSDQA